MEWCQIEPFGRQQNLYWQEDATVDEIISKYSAHPSVQKIKREFSLDKKFDLAYANAKGNQTIKYQIIKSLNAKIPKAKRPDGISAKFVKMLADIMDCHVANIINKDISNN